jgi:hypothetical protein
MTNRLQRGAGGSRNIRHQTRAVPLASVLRAAVATSLAI